MVATTTIKKIFALALLGGWSLVAVSAGNPHVGKTKARNCAACHGARGEGTSPLFPKLAGQNERYLVKQLKDFKSGTRKDPTMGAIAAQLSDEDIEDLAAYFASLPPPKGEGEGSEEGLAIFKRGISERKVPACSSCHGPEGQGNAPASFPRLQGQYAAYLIKTLKDFAEGKRGKVGGAMQTIASRLKEEEIKALAAHINALEEER